MAPRREVYDSHYPMMRNATKNRQFTKIFVNRDNNTFFRECKCQNRVVTRVFCPIAYPNDIVTGITELIDRTPPNAGIQKESHSGTPEVIFKGSIRSLPTCRRA